ncbi:MAG: tetratricopeptide repeat protein, partial [Bacteroidales bacterium]|nr:tetratricopeptide repeat protein [Bacteroidales bacterium]
IAKLYYKMGDYKASIFSFENIIKDFPDTQYKEEILFYIVKSYYKYAINSIKSKKKERYSFTVESYKNFLTIFPESDFMREASNIYENALEELNN